MIAARLQRKMFSQRPLNILTRGSSVKRSLDLLTLSHFDEDHISGVCELIRRFKIGTLLLPYTNLQQRLVFAFESGVAPNNRLMDFFLNPTAYLTNLGGPGIDRLLFVHANGGDGPSMPEGTVITPSGGDDFPELHFEIDRHEDAKDYPSADVGAQLQRRETSVHSLRRGSNIRLPNLWEFVPYNDDPQEKIGANFESQVEAARTRLFNSPDKRKRNAALRALKTIYDDELGGDSYERNVISLFLYSGPIYSSWRQTLLGNARVIRDPRPTFRFWHGSPFLREITKCSILYSGDGYLDTPERLNRFTDYLQKGRVDRAGVFQVMHHGSETNWHRGIAAELAPLFSVFSSDAEHKGFRHPHADVLRDFWRYGPVQVDKQSSFSVSGMLIR